MNIQIKSDLHLEFLIRYPDEFKKSNVLEMNPNADLLVLAGDICTLAQLNLLKDHLIKLEKPVIYVPGNHEYYGYDNGESVPTPEPYIKAFENVGNVHVLNNNSLEIDDVLFIGSTMWSNLTHPFDAAIASRCLGDFRAICSGNFTVKEYNQLHSEALEFIEATLKDEAYKDKKKVVVTHHSPSFKSVSDRFKGDPLNPAFHSNVEELIKQTKPNVWVHGHTHDRMKYMIESTLVVANPRGYANTPEPYWSGVPYDNNLLIKV